MVKCFVPYCSKVLATYMGTYTYGNLLRDEAKSESYVSTANRYERCYRKCYGKYYGGREYCSSHLAQ